MLKTTALASALLFGTNALAEQTINYSYLELGYGYLDVENQDGKGAYFDGSVAISDSFFLTGVYDNKELKNNNKDFNRYGISFGYHYDIDPQFNIYTELKVGQLEIPSDEGAFFGLDFGTRNILGKSFELISRLSYNIYPRIHSDYMELGHFEAELKGLYKFNQNHAIAISVETFDSDIGYALGYRFSF